MKKPVLLITLSLLLLNCSQFRNVQKVNFLSDLNTDAEYYTQTLPKNHIPLMVNEQVAHYIKIYSEESRQYLTKVLQRAYKYFPMMKIAFENEGLPAELIYLPIIESGFNMDAYSYKQASGPWQFIKGTGKLFGLHCDWWVDERRNPEKSTIAAVKHLNELYTWLHDWYLALAAYNAGGGTVAKAIQKYKSHDFWDMIRGNRMVFRKETKKYVPQFIAVTIICENLEKFGFSEIQKEEQLLYDEVEIPDATDLKLIADCCNTTYDTIKQLNPELRQWATPPRYENYKVRIPFGSKNQFVQKFSQILPEDRITFRRHQIKTGETIWSIAARYNVPRDMLITMNQLGKNTQIYAGRYLIIPIRGVEKAKEIDKLLDHEISKQ